MKDFKCPKCKSMIERSAEICPHCRTAWTIEEVAARTKEHNQAMGFGCLVVIILIVIAYQFIGGDDQPEAVPDKPASSAKVDAIAFYHKVMGTLAECDQAGGPLEYAVKSGDAVNLYQAADKMESACLTTPPAVREIKVPTTVGKKAFDDLTKTLAVCENLSLNRWAAAQAIKKSLDDPGSIAQQAELRETTSLIGSGSMLCAAGLVGTAMSFGATKADLISGTRLPR